MNAGSVAVVKLLLEHGTDASAACDAGSPVMWAAGSGKSATLEALLQGGADPNTPGNANVTAVLAASASGKQPESNANIESWITTECMDQSAEQLYASDWKLAGCIIPGM